MTNVFSLDFSYFERITSKNYRYKSNRNRFNQRDINSKRNLSSPLSIEGTDAKSSADELLSYSNQPNQPIGNNIDSNNNNSDQPCTSKQANHQEDIAMNELNAVPKSIGGVDDGIYGEDNDHMLFNHSIYHLEEENPIPLTQDSKPVISESPIDINNNHIVSTDNTNNQIKPEFEDDSNNPEEKCPITENLKATNMTSQSNDKNCTYDELNMSRDPVDPLNNTFCHTSLSGADKMSSGIDSSKVVSVQTWDNNT